MGDRGSITPDRRKGPQGPCRDVAAVLVGAGLTIAGTTVYNKLKSMRKRKRVVRDAGMGLWVHPRLGQCAVHVWSSGGALLIMGPRSNPHYRLTPPHAHATQIGVLPARYESSRFPGKPLIPILGIPMILRTYTQVGGWGRGLVGGTAAPCLSISHAIEGTQRPGPWLGDCCSIPLTLPSDTLRPQAKKAKTLDAVVIATDDERIASVCRAHGAEVAMTRPDCPNGASGGSIGQGIGRSRRQKRMGPLSARQ